LEKVNCGEIWKVPKKQQQKILFVGIMRGLIVVVLLTVCLATVTPTPTEQSVSDSYVCSHTPAFTATSSHIWHTIRDKADDWFGFPKCVVHPATIEPSPIAKRLQSIWIWIRTFIDDQVNLHQYADDSVLMQVWTEMRHIGNDWFSSRVFCIDEPVEPSLTTKYILPVWTWLRGKGDTIFHHPDHEVCSFQEHASFDHRIRELFEGVRVRIWTWIHSVMCSLGSSFRRIQYLSQKIWRKVQDPDIRSEVYAALVWFNQQYVGPLILGRTASLILLWIAFFIGCASAYFCLPHFIKYLVFSLRRFQRFHLFSRVLVRGQAEESECSICMENCPAAEIVTLPCNHSFCEACIQQWLTERNTCPYCRCQVVQAVGLEYPVLTELEIIAYIIFIQSWVLGWVVYI
jgi:hypothetical protein